MRTTLLLILRNLLRQKRRNFLLAVIIAFGMAVLILSGSIGDGMTDLMLNKMLVNWVGHIQVTIFEKLERNGPVIRNKENLITLLRKNLHDVTTIKESFDLWTRVIGNGRAADIYLASVEPSNEFFGTLRLESGDPHDFTNSLIDNAVIISAQYAKKLRVRVNDTINVSLKTINGQVQTAKLRVTGINRTSGTLWNNYSVYIKTRDLKSMMGYSDNETSSFRIILKDLETTRTQADALYKALKPATAFIPLNGAVSDFSILGFSTNESDLQFLRSNLGSFRGDWDKTVGTNSIMIPEKLALNKRLAPGMILNFSYPLMDKTDKTFSFVIGGIFTSADASLGNAVLINENDFKNLYYKNLPAVDTNKWLNSSILSVLVKEWTLMPRVHSSDEIEGLYDNLIKSAKNGAYLILTTVYEDNYGLLQWASIAQIISLVSVIILFIITQVGVLNTLRMSVRERTREIGTMRSIGMQKKEIRNLFLGETIMLTFFASILGICFAYIAMGLISSIYFNTSSEAFSIFILDSHIHFVTLPVKILFYILILIIIAFISAYFPARRAAGLSPSEALRHYE